MYNKLKKLINNSYSPYSKFRVGAILVTKDGNEFNGVNVENASYGASICAERSAFAQALSVGERNFKMLAIVGGKRGEYPLKNYCSPCGMCRQFISEFCDEDFKIILAKSVDDYKIFRLSELLPYSFHEQ